MSKPIALITGAAKRVGRAIALDLAHHGWDIIIHYNHSQHEAKECIDEIKALGCKACMLQADLSIQDDVLGLIPSCIEQVGVPTCLINNGSLFGDDLVQTMNTQSWDAHLNINLRAPVFLSQSFAKHLPDGEKGNIINIIDQRVWKPTPLFFSYGVSKAALWSATQTMAQALAPNIRVNAIGPGPVLQSIYQTKQQFDNQCALTPLERGTTPQEIAKAVRFLLDAPAVTGQMIMLDGGQHLAWQTPDVMGVENE